MRPIKVAVCALVVACGGDATAVSTLPPPSLVGTYRGTARGSENGALFNGVISSVTITAKQGEDFVGTWAVGTSAGSLTAIPLTGSPGYFTVALAQSAPCPGPATHLDGWAIGALRASDQQVLSFDLYYGGPKCLSTPLPATVFIKVTLTLQ